MELTNDFQVSVPVARAWAVLTDIERIAPCMPGADLQEVEGDEYRGAVRVKVGPITAQYKGAARMLEKDDGAHRAVVRAEGRETRGQGNANATITATLTEVDGGTRVQLSTDLTITGRVAQFGRGVLVDVSGKLLQQFVDCLEADVLVGSESTPPEGDPQDAESSGNASGDGQRSPASPVPSASPAEAPAAPAIRQIESRPSEPVNLVTTAGGPVVRRAAPLVAVLFLVWWLVRRRKKG